MAMKEIIDFMQELAEEEKLKVCINHSVLGGLIAGGTAAGLGFLLGPLGLLVGGTLGSGIAALLMSGKYVSAMEIIKNMNPEKKERLVGRVKTIMRNVNATDIAALIGLAAGNTAIRNQLVQELIEHFREMSMIVEGH